MTIHDDLATLRRGVTTDEEWKALDRVEAEIACLRDGLWRIAEQQTRTLDWLQANGIVFNGPLGNDPANWQNIAFSIYNDLCEVDAWAHYLLDEDLAGRSLLAGADTKEDGA